MNRAATCLLAVAIFLSSPVLASEEGAAQPAKEPPAFSLPGLDGQRHELADWKGKVILLNFWASWCSPCQSEIRDLIAWQDKYGQQGLQVVGIGMDEEKKLRNVHRSLGINYPVLYTDSPTHPVMARFGNMSGIVPYSVLISREGTVVYEHTGLFSSETFEEQVIPLLK